MFTLLHALSPEEDSPAKQRNHSHDHIPFSNGHSNNHSSHSTATGDEDAMITGDKTKASEASNPVEEFMTAVRFGLRAEVFLLLKASPSLSSAADSGGFLASHWAARNGDVDTLKALHEFGANLSSPSQNEESLSPLHWAAIEGRLPAMRCLLDFRVPIDAVDSSGCTPLICAVKAHQPNAIIFLFKNGGSCIIHISLLCIK